MAEVTLESHALLPWWLKLL